MKSKSRLDGSVQALLHLIYNDGVDAEMIDQVLPKFLWQIRHLLKGIGTLFPKPLMDLLGPKLRLSHTDQGILQRRQIQ